MSVFCTQTRREYFHVGSSAAVRGFAEQNPFERRQVRLLTCRDPALTHAAEGLLSKKATIAFEAVRLFEQTISGHPINYSL